MKNIKTNSKYLKKHDLFLPTSRVIEKEYLKDALKKKASAIISDNSINLKADTLFNGNGTSTDPYVVL